MVIVLVFSVVAFPLLAIDASDSYRSPRNPERKIRRATRLIVLHTTEAPARSSLNKLSDRGEAHFCVTEAGQVYRIVDRDREAFHAGRSMWNGIEDVDKYSIGIECVGYHNKAMPMVQLKAIRTLVKELQSMYGIPDHYVVCHSHVAYGAPNRWQKRRHRGRKRCGMLFAMPTVRRILGLRTRPAYDPDTRAGRLIVGDPYLQNVLYANCDTMVAAYRNGGPAQPSAGNWFTRFFGAAKAETRAAPPAARQVVQAAKTVARKATTPAPAAAPRTINELKSRGWQMIGSISKTKTASSLAGSRWNAADTYYTIRDKVISGKNLNAAHIERGMCVWLKK